MATGDFPCGGGEVGALARRFDWSGTELGPPEHWPVSLRAYVSMILEMPTPAILFWGSDQTQIYNDGYAAIMGPRHPTYFAAPYRECWPDTYPVIHPWMQRVLAGEVVQVTDQHFLLTRHGFTEEAYFTFTFSPVRDDDGQIAGILQPVVEVTDRVLSVRRTETLRQLEAHLDALAHNPKDLPFTLVYVWDGEDLVLAASSGFDGAPPDAARLSSAVRGTLASGEIVDVDVVDVLGQPHVGIWQEPTRRARVLPIHGGVMVLGVSPRLRLDDAYVNFLDAVGRQVATHQAAAQARRLEAELLDRERAAHRDAEIQKEHLVALFTQAPTPMVVLRGPQLLVEIATPLTFQVWMRERHEVLGRPIFEVLPELRGQVFERMLRDVYDLGVTRVGEETLATLENPDGTTREVYFTFVYSPLRTADGLVDGVLVLAFDVTEQVRARQGLDELRRAAESASRAKDEFFAILGHELRNPLAPLLTALKLLRCRVSGPELDVIERQARHLVRLVDDLLDVSRIISGKCEIGQERVAIGDVVAWAVEMAGPLLEERGHELTLDVEPGLEVVGDGGRLAQALANLLTNAAKYTEAGGHVAVRARSTGDDEVELEVEDDGIGIPSGVLPQVFDTFAQEHQAIDRAQGGLGLGLAIVRGIVERHGGSVHARSEGRGCGSTFTVRLSRTPAGAPEPAGSAVVAGSCEGDARRCVLIVDDNRDAANLLGDWLSAHGHDVHVAYDGPSALALARQLPVEVGILDIGLPAMDGYEVARRLRARGQEPLHLVALTGYASPADRERAEQAGFDAHLVKPMDPAELERLVRALS